jgi:hypothetical protein
VSTEARRELESCGEIVRYRYSVEQEYGQKAYWYLGTIVCEGIEQSLDT